MKIAGPKDHIFQKRTLSEDLESLLNNNQDIPQERTCENCTIPCPCSGSSTCACDCSVDCVQAPQALSIDPIRYPIEIKSVPLVYELSSLKVVQPCWSCEGHLGFDGKLHKIPQVWFYSKTVYLDLITRHIKGLSERKLLNYQWHVREVDYGSHDQECYSIEPKGLDIHTTDLELLQADLLTIARDMAEQIRGQAEARLSLLNKHQP